MAYNTIKIKNYSDVNEEFVAAAAITPGHLVEVASTGKAQVHSTADGNVIPMFACEDELQGKGITDAYAANDQVQVWVPGRGDIAYALLKDGETAVIGSFLTSAGDGTLKVYDAIGSAGAIENPALIVGVAVEAVDMSGSALVDPSGRIKVRIY